jgi:hypothetical protein
VVALTVADDDAVVAGGVRTEGAVISESATMSNGSSCSMIALNDAFSSVFNWMSGVDMR